MEEADPEFINTDQEEEKNRYRHQLLLKVPQGVPSSRVREGLAKAESALGSLPQSIRMTIDVDPAGVV